MCLQSWHQIPRKIFLFLKLRFRLSFFPGSHHVPWQHKYTKCLRKHSQHQVSCFKQQNSNHAHNNSNMRNTAIKPIKNNFYFSSWCLPQICQQLQVLNAFKNVALAIVIERHMTTKQTSNTQQNNMQTKLCLLRQSACLAPFKTQAWCLCSAISSFLKTTSEPRVDKINYSLVVTPGEFRCLWHSAQV